MIGEDLERGATSRGFHTPVDTKGESPPDYERAIRLKHALQRVDRLHTHASFAFPQGDPTAWIAIQIDAQTLRDLSRVLDAGVAYYRALLRVAANGRRAHPDKWRKGRSIKIAWDGVEGDQQVDQEFTDAEL